MNKISRRTYYDVTQLVHWTGKITGIPRVMHELAVQFQRDNPETVFVAWVKEIQEFCEIDLTRALAQRGHGIAYVKVGETATPPGSLATDDGASDGQPDASTPTPSTKLYLTRVAKAGLRRAAKVTPRLAATAENRLRQKHFNSLKRIVFVEHDRLFIPWGEWWDGNFIKKLQVLARNNGADIIQVIHDMGPIIVPQFSGSGRASETFPVYCREVLPICALVLAVSKNTQQEIIKWLKAQDLPVPPIAVFREGDNFEVATQRKPHEQRFIDSKLKGDDYILCVGTIEAKKNHYILYLTYKLALQRGITLPTLIIAGRLGWKTENIVDLIREDPEVNQRIILLNDVSDEELAWLYGHCKFTIISSLYEGWGMPIAESVARGIPCACSNTTSMVEIAEDYVTHFSPTSTDECLAAIVKLMDPQVLKDARNRLRDYRLFSWDDSYIQVKQHIAEKLS